MKWMSNYVNFGQTIFNIFQKTAKPYFDKNQKQKSSFETNYGILPSGWWVDSKTERISLRSS